MLHKIFFLILALCLFESGGWAQELTKIDPACTCDKNIQDPYEEPVKFNFGKFNGQCIDSCRFRSAKVLSAKDCKIKGIKPDDMIIGNFLHLSKFYIAVVPDNAVIKIDMGFEEFRPKIHHIFTRFHLDPKTPVKLYTQSAKPEFVTQTNTVVISSEGTPAAGEPYSLLESYMENYILIDRIVSGEEINRTNQTYQHVIKFYALDLSKEQGNEMLRSGFIKSEKVGFQRNYKLFTNNCSTSALGLLNSVIKYPASTAYLKIVEEALPIEAPLGLLQALRSRKVLKQETPIEVMTGEPDKLKNALK